MEEHEVSRYSTSSSSWQKVSATDMGEYRYYVYLRLNPETKWAETKETRVRINGITR